MKQKLMKIRLEKDRRTDLICIGCENFRTEWANIGDGVKGTKESLILGSFRAG